MTSDGEMLDTDDGTRDPVLARLQPRWSATRTEDNLAVAFRRIERGRRLRRVGAAGVATLGALALVAGVAARRPFAPAPMASRAPEAAARRLALPDGSTVALGDAQTRAVVTRTSPERIEVELAGGPATFEIPARRRAPSSCAWRASR